MSLNKVYDGQGNEHTIDSPSQLIVTIDDNNVASHTSAEIYAHVQSGGTAVLESNGYTYVLVGCTADYASFDHSYDDDLRDSILIYDDGSVEKREYTNVYSNALNNRIPVPTTAEVGQTIIVKSVDSNGKPNAWECADLPKKLATCWCTGRLMLFEEGMTWKEFCDSNYNYQGIYYDEGNGLLYDAAGDIMADVTDTSGPGHLIYANYIIDPLATYDSQ